MRRNAKVVSTFLMCALALGSVSCASQCGGSGEVAEVRVSREAALLMAKQATSGHSVQEWNVSLEDDGSARIYVVEGTGTAIGEWLQAPVVEVDARDGGVLRSYVVMRPPPGYFSGIDPDDPGWIRIAPEEEAWADSGEADLSAAWSDTMPVDASAAIRIAVANGFGQDLEPWIKPWTLIQIRYRDQTMWLVRAVVTRPSANLGWPFAQAVVDATTGSYEYLGVSHKGAKIRFGQ